tara:strand:- start:60 stop:833 length:774 start_codon:yes stop_codon:yes gene_type:complete
MSDEELKQECKDWAIAYKEKTGKFPNNKEFTINRHPDDPPPCGTTKVMNLFGSYNNFREFCGEIPRLSFSTLKEAFEYQLANKIVTESGCWHSFNIKPNKVSGYCILKFSPTPRREKNFYLHVLSYFYHKDGDVTLESYEDRDLNLKVRHMCAKNPGENRECFNPDHLELGTQVDNINDTKSYHAGFKATKNIYNILIEHDENIAAGMLKTHSCKALGLKYAVSDRTISNIVDGHRWKGDPGRLQYEAEKNKSISTS